MGNQAVTTELFYEIDAFDTIVRIDGLWDRFASENGAPHLSAESILGTLLWDHIAGAENGSLVPAACRARP